ncbi:23274_t:CDS:1 [Cetraspora pellucida]|uniref:23274_t:CDS:1 n=1 Tax=Cetraspora pellucida TaxID=1433469 RepID=A0A9N9GW79_9GLOM|nr:23274_t:CDS:1 [Cetraspora pellucida]
MNSINTIVAKLHNVIYNSLWHYWPDTDRSKLIATLLDSRVKQIDIWPDKIQEQAIIKLYNEFQNFVISTKPTLQHPIHQPSIAPFLAPNFMKKFLVLISLKLDMKLKSIII